MDLKLNKDTSIDIERLIESRLVILANSGAGKSWLIRRIAEQAAGKIQTIILDPEGEFSTLREKFDFLHAGKDADVPAEPKSAALLALKLLELGTSAIVDLYELHPQERQRFVKLFCDALVNCPKELYHPVLIILDEAHDYVPEGKPSEATYSVEALASKGRKRGQCLVLASQRISKLSKNAASECNNKLIGRASQDIDMKRAGDELGLTKDKIVQLRQLKPGEFYAFGPAISDEVQKIQVGDVKTTHAKVGYAAAKAKKTPPTAAIKKVLAKLKDLPEEAVKEARTSAELKQQVRDLSRKLSEKPAPAADPKAIEKAVNQAVKAALHKQDLAWEKVVGSWKKYGTTLKSIVAELMAVYPVAGKKIEALNKPHDRPDGMWWSPSNVEIVKIDPTKKILDAGFKTHYTPPTPDTKPLEIGVVKKWGPGELAVLGACAQHTNGITREHLTVLTGYKRASRNTYLQRLGAAGLVRSEGERFFATQQGIEELGDSYTQLPESGPELVDHVMKTLPPGEAKILQALLDNPEGVEREELTNITGYTRASRNTYIQRLGARQLVVVQGSIVKAADILL